MISFTTRSTHTPCHRGSNPFGLDFEAAGYAWTSALWYARPMLILRCIVNATDGLTQTN